MVTSQPTLPVPATPAAAADSAGGRLADPAPASPVQPAAVALRVSASSRPAAVAGAIAGMVREHGRAEVQAIGAGAINQAVKAIAIARDYLAPAGVDLICVPSFIDVMVDTEQRTAIKLLVEPH